MLRRLTGIFLLIVLGSMGTGLLLYVHNLQHAAEDAAEAAAYVKATGKPAPPHQDHDDDNCQVHAQIHIAMSPATGWVPLLVLLGLWVAFVTQLPHTLISHRGPARIDCRGPPVLGLA